MDFSEQVRLSNMAEYDQDDETRVSPVERTSVMPAIRKSTVAPALQDGLNVRGTKSVVPVKASKATVAKVTGNAPKGTTTRKVAKSVPAKAAPVKVVTSVAPVVVFTDDMPLTVASAAVKKVLTAKVADLFGDNHLTARKTAIKNAVPFWAQANRNITRTGNRIAARGEWFVALDFTDDSPMGLVTALVNSKGEMTHLLKADDNRLDSFTYLTA